MFRLAWKNIISNPLNLVLNLLLLSLGVGLISFLFIVNDQLKDKFDKNLAGIDMVIGAKGSPLQMILCGMYHIDNPTGNIEIGEAKAFLNPKHPLIKTSVPLSLGDSYQGFRIVGTEHIFLDLYDAKISEGKLWEDVLDVTIGSSVASTTGLKIGDTFYSSHGFNQDDDMAHDHAYMKVVGILQSSGSVADQLILTHTASVWAMHDHEEESPVQDTIVKETYDRTSLLSKVDKEITSILVQFKNRTNFQALNMPRNINQNTDLQAASPAFEINRLYAMMGTGTRILQILALLIAIVSAISIFISLYNNLRNRRYELALMRVSGARPNTLFLLIILEGVILSILGAILGLLFCRVAMVFMAKFMGESYKYEFSNTAFHTTDIYILAVAIILGILAALIPAIQAYRTDIHRTLSKT